MWSFAEEEEPLVPWWLEDPPWSLDIRAVGLPEEVEDDEEVFLVLELIVTTDDFFPLLLVCAGAPDNVLAGADVFLLTETVLGRLSRLPPKTLISLPGAEAFRGDAVTAVFILVGLVWAVLKVRPGLPELTGVDGARIDLDPGVFEPWAVKGCKRLTGVVLFPFTLLLTPLGVSISGVRGFMVGDLRQRCESGDNARRRSRSRGGAHHDDKINGRLDNDGTMKERVLTAV